MKNLTGKMNTLLVVFKLLFPLRVFRWVVYGSVVMLALASLLNLEWLIAVAAGCILLTVFFGAVCVPMQAASLASSRPFSLLGNSRQWLLLMLMLIGVVFSLAIQWVLAHLDRLGFIASLPVLWLMVSLVLQSGAWICSRWPGFNGFIFMLNPLFDDIAAQLHEQNPIGVVVALIVSWGVFSIWWLQWKPEKYQINNMNLPSGELQKRQMEGMAASRLMQGKASSWIGARLLGFSDSWSVLARRMFGSLALVVFILVPITILIGIDKFLPFLQVSTPILLLTLSGVIAQTTATKLYRNIRVIWLCSSGGRSDLIAITRRIYMREVGSWTFLTVVIAMMVEIASGGWKGAESWGLMLFSIILLQVLLFYTAWFIYQRKAASVMWLSWVCGGVFLAWLCSIIATGFLFPLPFELQGISNLWVWMPELLAIVLIHSKVHRQFAAINLLRAV